MKHDRVFRGTAARTSDFEFNAEVAKVFDDMVTRSVPFYQEQQHMIADIVKKFWIEGTQIYDLGCSTATTLINLCREISSVESFVGYDNSVSMLEKAREKIKECRFDTRIELRQADLNGDLSRLVLDNASVVTMCWTLQFVRPLQRDKLIKWIHEALVQGGVLIVTEKILTNDSHMNRFFVDFYYDFKKRTGYSAGEILHKREALENVLIPYRIDENLELFRRNNFDIVETFFQWYNFAGFLCVKKSD
ncbi:MAG: carboxy-S-adenosyl-L-methionine synthase CmoA [Gammaproteobacteria bacterium]|nr:carboxy-S-adenosyl-L-methionine synthase CmoA [Gammaproteobacteria bacterium]